MKLPQYITTEEVQRVCRELGIRDWTSLTEAAVPVEEAQDHPGRSWSRGDSSHC